MILTNYPRRFTDSPVRRVGCPRGAISIEYMVILALVVIPIGLMVPMILHMIAVYGDRIGVVLRLPFG